MAGLSYFNKAEGNTASFPIGEKVHCTLDQWLEHSTQHGTGHDGTLLYFCSERRNRQEETDLGSRPHNGPSFNHLGSWVEKLGALE